MTLWGRFMFKPHHHVEDENLGLLSLARFTEHDASQPRALLLSGPISFLAVLCFLYAIPLPTGVSLGSGSGYWNRAAVNVAVRGPLC